MHFLIDCGTKPGYGGEYGYDEYAAAVRAYAVEQYSPTGEAPKVPPEFDRVVAAVTINHNARLEALTEMMGDAGHLLADFIPQHAIARNVVIAHPILMPNFFGRGKDSDGNKAPFYLSELLETKIGKHDFNFGFVEVAAEKKWVNKDGFNPSVFLPAVALDRQVFRNLKILSRLDEVPQQTELPAGAVAAQGVFEGVYQALTNSTHDVLHIFTLSVFTKNMGAKRRSGVAAIDAPMDDSIGEIPAYIKFDNKVRDLARKLSDYAISAYELWPTVLNFQMWQHIFEKHPEMKSELIDDATRFMENVLTVKQAILAEYPHATAMADDMGEYLSVLYMTKLGMFISLDDKDLEKGERSLAGAIRKLGNPPYSPKMEAIKKEDDYLWHYIDGVSPTPVYRKLTEELLRLGTRNRGSGYVSFPVIDDPFEAIKLQAKISHRAVSYLSDDKLVKDYPAVDLLKEFVRDVMPTVMKNQPKVDALKAEYYRVTGLPKGELPKGNTR